MYFSLSRYPGSIAGLYFIRNMTFSLKRREFPYCIFIHWLPDCICLGLGPKRANGLGLNNKMAVKRAKLTPIAKTKERGFEGVTLYILPKKLSKSRVEFLNSLACKRGFTVADSFRYTKWHDRHTKIGVVLGRCYLIVPTCRIWECLKSYLFHFPLLCSDNVTHVVANYESFDKVRTCLQRWVKY